MHPAPAEVIPDAESSEPRTGIPPEQPNDVQLRPRRLRRWILIAAAALVLGTILFWAMRSKTPTIAKSSLRDVTIPTQVLRLKGTTEAVQSRAILAPLLAGQQVPTLTIIHLTPGGTRVKRGDVLVEFDRQAQTRDFIDKQAEYAKLVDQVAEERAKENAARAKDETELKTAEDNLRKTELEIQKAEIVSRIDAEKNQENLDEAKATYEQLRETFDLKRKAAQAAIRILEIQRDRTQQTMLHAQANADLMQIHSPLDGVVVLNTIWKQGTMGEVQEGDQVRPGVPFMQVVDPATMQVRVMANQQDFPSLRVGQTAKVRLDAYPDLVFAAKLDQLAPIGESGDFSNKLRSFVVIVAIDGNDPKLMPDLSAAVDVNVATQSAGTTTGVSSEGESSEKNSVRSAGSGS
jgi:multidrug efflux pump subunit AcrA (membrane-fusion protein)